MKAGLTLFLCLLSTGCASMRAQDEGSTIDPELLRSAVHEVTYGMTQEQRQAEIAAQPDDVKEVIRQEAIRLGMTSAQVILSVGKPQKTNRTVGSWGVHEQWIYEDVNLYFEQGVVTSWQDRR